MELQKESFWDDNKATINAKSIPFRDLTFFSLITIDLGLTIYDSTQRDTFQILAFQIFDIDLMKERAREREREKESGERSCKVYNKKKQSS